MTKVKDIKQEIDSVLDDIKNAYECNDSIELDTKDCGLLIRYIEFLEINNKSEAKRK